MLGGMTMEVSEENCRIVTEELADGGRTGVKIGEGRGRRQKRRGRRRVRTASGGGFMEYVAAGRIHY